MADDAGALLVRTGLINDQSLLAARQHRASTGGTIGEHLVLANLIPDESLTEFYRARLLVPRVNPNTLARLTAPVIQAIPGDMAVEFRCVPIALDRDGNLTVAMSDPSDSHAVDEIGFFTGKYVVRAVATQMQIAWCLAHYYGHITELGRRLLRPSGSHAGASHDAAARDQKPRVRGFTGRIEAARHKVLPPTGTPPPLPRPSNQLLTPTAEDLARVAAAEAPPPATPAEPASAAPAEPAPASDSEPYSQVHVSLLDENTPPRGVKRSKPAEPDPPELAARSGEMVVNERRGPAVDPAVPAVVIELGSAPARVPIVEDGESATELQPVDDLEDVEEITEVEPDVDEDEPAIIHDEAILLTAKRAPPRDTIPDDSDEHEAVVLLDRKKPETGPRRPHRQTDVGLGVPNAAPRARGVSAPAATPAAAAAMAAAVAATPPAAAPRAATDAGPADTRWSVATPADGVPRVLDELRSDAQTRPHTTDTPPPTRHRHGDDGWGPPGTTIPPPFLGAMPGTEPGAPAAIPIPDDEDEVTDDPDDSRPLQVVDLSSAPIPMHPPPSMPVSAHLVHNDPIATVRALEQASTRLVELLRLLDRARTRDEVIAAVLDYLHLSHDRVAFLALKDGWLMPFLQRPAMPQTPPKLTLDQPSTLQDVVGTRLPYRGVLADDASRQFVTSTFGVAPSEVLLLPIAVRERVVAVLFGDGGHGHSFDEHFAIAGRAAGLALERILQAKRAATQP